MSAKIARERPDSADALQLIGELERYIAPVYPHDSDHGLSPAEMVEKGVAFFIVRCDGVPAGCGGVLQSGPGQGEIMRMYVRPPYRGRGLGKLILRRLEQYAKGLDIGVLRLKTGIYQPEALGLYERAGYRQVAAFGTYRDHPLNQYYEKRILKEPWGWPTA